jgi:ferrous iron transport protein A
VSNTSTTARTLADADTGVRHAVAQLECPAGAEHWGRWLEEIGFLPGEPVVLKTRAQPGGDPMVVRIGSSTFALRRAEAACVRLADAPAEADHPAR